MSDNISLHPEAIGAGLRLPAPFLELAVLKVGAATHALGRPDAAQLVHAWTPVLLGDGSAMADGELRGLSQGSGLTFATGGAAPAAGAGLLCTLSLDAGDFCSGEVPRALSPGIDLRLLAGAGFWRESAVLADQPCALAVVKIARMMRFEFRAEYPARAVAVIGGAVQCAGQPFAAGTVEIINASGTVYLDAAEPSVLVLMAGQD
jgi:hypothetical protein